MQTFYDSLIAPLMSKQATGKLRHRDAFGYMEPDPSIPDFAQCSSCRVWLIDRKRCLWLSDDKEVVKDDSCILYVQGTPLAGDIEATGALTSGEVGFVSSTKTRCQNCVSLTNGKECGLFQKLNEQFPDIFDLDEGVKPRACCNAFIEA